MYEMFPNRTVKSREVLGEERNFPSRAFHVGLDEAPLRISHTHKATDLSPKGPVVF